MRSIDDKTFVHRFLGAMLFSAVTLNALGCSGDASTTPATSTPQSGPSASAATGDGDNPATDYSQLVLGTWEDDYKGKRTLTVHEDGTATMIVEPAGLNALFAERLQFEETWSIDGEHLEMKVTGGEPKERVKLICQMMGDSSRQQILVLNSERMKLLDEDGKTEYEWRRAKHGTERQ